MLQDWGPVVAVATVSMTGLGLENPWRGTTAALVLTALATALPLGWRRTLPAWTGAAVGVALGLQTHVAGGSLHFGSFCAVLIATFSIGRYAAARGAAVGGVLTLGGLVVVAQARELRESPADIVFPLFYLTAAWFVGRGIRVLHDQASRLRLLNETLERDRENRALLAVAEERMRLARELHDVVGHTVTLMVLQAAAAEETLTRDPDATRRSLVAVQAAGRRGMEDLRSVLDVLSAPGAGPGEGLDALVDRMAAAGVRLELDGHEALDEVGGVVSTALLRVAQESLTNVLRHSRADRVAVRVVRTDGEVQLLVTDPGPARTTDPGDHSPGGRGLASMRERVEQLGGRIQVGPSGAGFSVAASLPVGALG